MDIAKQPTTTRGDTQPETLLGVASYNGLSGPVTGLGGSLRARKRGQTTRRRKAVKDLLCACRNASRRWCVSK